MKKLFAVILVLLFCLPALAQDNAPVVVSGYGLTEEAAIKNAFVNAVEQTVGTFITSSVMIENGQLINEKILSASNGFIESHKKISSAKQGDMFKVTIEAVVKKTLLKERTLELVKSDVAVDTNVFAQAFTKANQFEQSKALIKEKFPKLAERFADTLRAETKKIDFDTNAIDKDGNVPYAMQVEFFVDMKLYNEASREMSVYLTQMASSHTRTDMNQFFASVDKSKFPENSITLVYADSANKMVVDQFVVLAATTKEFRNIFMAKLLSMTDYWKGTMDWQISVTDKAGVTTYVNPSKYTDESGISRDIAERPGWNRANWPFVGFYSTLNGEQFEKLNPYGMSDYDPNKDDWQERGGNRYLIIPYVDLPFLPRADEQRYERQVKPDKLKEINKRYMNVKYRTTLSGAVPLSDLENISKMGIARVN